MFKKLFERLSESKFRSRFHLSAADRAYIEKHGTDTVRAHAADFVAKRLAPAFPENDGKQTPMRGHPVFVAQHATGCCCRGCFEKWHHVLQGTALTDDEIEYAVSVLMEWICRELERPAPPEKAKPSAKTSKRTSKQNPGQAELPF